MSAEKPANDNLEMGRLAVRHYFIRVAIFAFILVGVFGLSFGTKVGIAIALTFAGLLLPAWQLSSIASVHAGKYKELDKAARDSLLVSLAGIVFTAAGYALSMSSMFD